MGVVPEESNGRPNHSAAEYRQLGDVIVFEQVQVLGEPGMAADIAEDGNEAMKKVETGAYDLIIADLRMPSGFTGERLHRFIELKDPDLAQRMIFITGDAINPETRKFLQNAGNMYLEKPFPPESLQQAIETSLVKGKAAK